jgi:hypothetical protein
MIRTLMCPLCLFFALSGVSSVGARRAAVAMATSKPAPPSTHQAPPGHATSTSAHPPSEPSGSSGYHPTTYHPTTYHGTGSGTPANHSTNYHSNSTNVHSDSTNYHSTQSHYHSESTNYHPDSTNYGAPSSHSVHGIAHGHIADPKFYSSVSSYHYAHYHTNVNRVYALHPHDYHGYWKGGWYHGYWYGYWGAQPWLWYQGYYGFWLAAPTTTIFVAETAPGVCSYWNGYAWVPYWNPPYTPYYCPY